METGRGEKKLSLAKQRDRKRDRKGGREQGVQRKVDTDRTRNPVMREELRTGWGEGRDKEEEL